MFPTPVNHTTQNTSQLTRQPQLTSQPHTTLKTDVVKFSFTDLELFIEEHYIVF